MPSAELATIVAMLRENPMFGAGDFAAQRAQMELLAGAVPLPPDVRHTPIDAGGVPAEWVETDDSDTDRCLIYFHGGGYAIGSPRTHRALVARIARAARARALSVDYRRAPEHPYPAAVDDAVAAYRFALGAGLASEQIAFAGDSAGGGLTMATLVALRDAGDVLPAAGVCISPWVDLTLSGASIETKADVDPMLSRARLEAFAAAYAGDADRRTPGISPLFADLAGLPEILVHVGTAETLLDDALRLVERLRAARVEVSLDAYEEMIHVWHAFATILPEARDAIERIGDFLRRRLAP